jgi:uncharacterized Zn finger protein (UPF0148 family)
MQPVFEGYQGSPQRRGAAASSGTPSAQMGSLLLAGWTMLAESCQDCACPLMREPGSGDQRDELCVSCGRRFLGGDPVDTAGATAAAPAQPAAAAVAAAAIPSSVNGPPSPVAAAAARSAASPRSSPAAAARSAAASGAASPARSSPLRPAGGPRARAPPTAATRQLPLHDRRAGPSASDRAADVLSERMLQGWALLDNVCPL